MARLWRSAQRWRKNTRPSAAEISPAGPTKTHWIGTSCRHVSFDTCHLTIYTVCFLLHTPPALKPAHRTGQRTATRAKRVYTPAMAASNSSAQGRKDERIRAASGAVCRHAHAVQRVPPAPAPVQGVHLRGHGPFVTPPIFSHHGACPVLSCPALPTRILSLQPL